jgi:uncharacterized membrane protein
MAEPVCPKGYECVFTPPDVPFQGPWWEGSWGIVVGILAVVALVIVLCTMLWWHHERASDKTRRKEREAERKHALDVEQQRTMQLDAAQGNPEVLKLVRDIHRA